MKHSLFTITLESDGSYMGVPSATCPVVAENFDDAITALSEQLGHAKTAVLKVVVGVKVDLYQQIVTTTKD